MTNQQVEIRCRCGQTSWYQEGKGEGAIRCCRHCGFILVQLDMSKNRPKIDLTNDEASALRRRAGVPEDVIERLSSGEDINCELGQRKKERKLFGGWAVGYVVLVLCFRGWLFEPCETRQQAIGLGVFLFAVLVYIVFRFVRAQLRIAAIEVKEERLFKPSIDTLSEKSDIRTLIWALGQPDDYRRAAQALVAIGLEASTLLRATLRDPNEDWLRRKNAAWVLGKLKDHEAVPDLIVCLKDPNHNVQQGACMGLGILRDQRAVPALIACFQEGCSLKTKAFAIENVMKVTAPDHPEILVMGLVSLLRRIAAWQKELREGTVPDDLKTELEHVDVMEGELVDLGFVDPVERVRKQLSLFVERSILPTFKELGNVAINQLNKLIAEHKNNPWIVHYASLASAQINTAWIQTLINHAKNDRLSIVDVMFNVGCQIVRLHSKQIGQLLQWANENNKDELAAMIRHWLEHCGLHIED